MTLPLLDSLDEKQPSPERNRPVIAPILLPEGFSFAEEQHRYTYQRAAVLSVTQSLTISGLIDQTWFSDFARDRGKAVHLTTEYDDDGTLDEDSVTPLLRPYLAAKRSFMADTKFVVGGIEELIFVPGQGYAGRLDRRGWLDGRRAIVDYKSGLLPWWCAWQTAAYANGVPDGASYARYGVQLKDDGTYKIERYDARHYRRDLSDFLGAAVRNAQVKIERGFAALPGETNG